MLNKIGYTGPQFSHTAHNFQDSFTDPWILDDALLSECSKCRLLGPFNAPPLSNLWCLGLGIVPKYDGGWRTIYHLSAPICYSINNFIDPHAYTLSNLKKLCHWQPSKKLAWQAYEDVTETFQYLASHSFEYLNIDSIHFQKSNGLQWSCMTRQVHSVL